MAQEPTVEDLKKRINGLEAQVSRYKIAWETMGAGEKWFSQIVQGMSIAAFVIDRRHRVIICNKAYEKLTGIPMDEILGTDKQWMTFYKKKRPVMADLVVDDASEETFWKYYGDRCRKSSAIEGAYEAEGFFPSLGRDGKWLFYTAAPLKDADGKITGAMETLQDITEQKRTLERFQASERRLRLLLDFVPYPVVVFTGDGKVNYLNPAFSRTYGWTPDELYGSTIAWEPEGDRGQTACVLDSLLKGESPKRFETRRLTKDGRLLDVIVRATRYSDSFGGITGVLMISRDVTREKREARKIEAIHRISLALPAHPELRDLLDYISGEVRRLIGCEGAIVMLYDAQREELLILGAAYEDQSIQKRIKEIRFSLDKLVAGRVVQTGKPVLDNEAWKKHDLYRERDETLGYKTLNHVMVPLFTNERIIGILGAVNKKAGLFDNSDIELLDTLGSTVALSIENARYARALKTAYEEVRSLNSAKDKVINHLSHELKTPVAILSGSLRVLDRKLQSLPDGGWRTTMNRIVRNLDRISEIQNEVGDIMNDGHYEIKELLSVLLNQCADALETLVAQETGEENIVERLEERIDEIFTRKKIVSIEIPLHLFIEERLSALAVNFDHRNLKIERDLQAAPCVFLPREILGKVLDGLIKNAVENTPDGGKIYVSVRPEGKGAILMVKDCGIGIIEDAQKRIFEGFFHTHSTMAYSTGRPFDFNAGGKGVDLLQAKIFSERYGFKIDMVSSRCPLIPKEEDLCPGNAAACAGCKMPEDCFTSGGTVFSVYFPPK